MVEARIQVYMDKLSTWQLVNSLETQAMPSSTETKDNGHDWSQSIYLSVIEPRYVTKYFFYTISDFPRDSSTRFPNFATRCI